MWQRHNLHLKTAPSVAILYFPMSVAWFFGRILLIVLQFSPVLPVHLCPTCSCSLIDGADIFVLTELLVSAVALGWCNTQTTTLVGYSVVQCLSSGSIILRNFAIPTLEHSIYKRRPYYVQIINYCKPTFFNVKKAYNVIFRIIK